MTDAEIFKRNVKRICKEKHLKMGYIDLEAGYSEKYVSQMAYKGSTISIDLLLHLDGVRSLRRIGRLRERPGRGQRTGGIHKGVDKTA